MDPDKVFGVCIIHNLNPSYIFQDNVKIKKFRDRFSEMKWDYKHLNNRYINNNVKLERSKSPLPIIKEKEYY